jgi:hypothetical protein
VVAIDGPHLLLQREPQRVAEIIAGFVLRLATTPAYTSQTTRRHDP